MDSATLTKDLIVTASKDQVSCDMGGEAAILDSNSGIYFGLTGIGARIWELIQKPRRVDEILAILLEEYDVEPARCERDLWALLKQLSDKQLIVTRDAAAD